MKYLKFISAIKMGRPKKADGSDIGSSNLTSSPKSARQPSVDVDDQQNSTNPQLGEDSTNDSLKTSSVCPEIKKEARSSCDYEKKWSGNRAAVTSWEQGESQVTNNNAGPTGPQTTGTVTSPEFIEEEMDEILMMLQNDNQAGAPSSKKMRSFDYNCMASMQRTCKSEYDADAVQQHQQQWRMSMSDRRMSEPVNMAPSHMGPLASRPPPQYPGFSHSYPPPQMPTMMAGSPCQSPPTRSMPSPGGYMSDMSSTSPGYMSHGSPVHSPACQFSPKHSPMYQSSPSPHSPYQDSTPQGSPYSDSMYHQHPFSPDNNSYHVTDLSLNVNCGPQQQQQMRLGPGSPHQISPSYPSGHMPTQLSPSHTMTIPPQEGGANSQDGWGLPGSPQHNMTGFPNQEGSYRRCSTRLENIQRINNHFLTNPNCDLQLIPDVDGDAKMTRSDIEGEIVNKTLSSICPSDSYYYVLSDSHSHSNESGCSSNYDEFTSCSRLFKRKSMDEDLCDSPRVDGTGVGRFKRHMTEKYWQASVDQEDTFPLTTEKQAILEHLNKIFQQMTERYADDSNNKQQQVPTV